MSRHDYWREALAECFDEHGIVATATQIDAVARDIECIRDGESLAFHTPENPLIRKNQELEKMLRSEKRKRFCVPCQGTGRDRYMAGPWHVDTECMHCRGLGKVTS